MLPSGARGAARTQIVGALLLAAVGAGLYLLRATDFFRAVPGDLGDARFNSVVLEHLFQWVSGDVASLGSPPFFYPSRDTLAFSDNHFGSGLVYVLARWLGLAREQAFDAWFTTGFALNFIAMFVAARRLRFSVFASAVAGFVYTFGLPALAQEGHAQLTYRFAVPMAYLAFIDFARQPAPWPVARMAAWGAMQFYCSIYLGVFMAYLLAAAALAMCVPKLRLPPRAALRVAAPRCEWWVAAMLTLMCAAAVAALLAYYLRVSRAYGFGRSPDEMLSMLPRWQSYWFADLSALSGWLGRHLDRVPMQHEHQLFMGFVPLALCLWAWLGRRRDEAPRRRLLAHSTATALLLVLATLSVEGVSLYRLAMSLPGVLSIRAVARIVLVLALPAAIVTAVAVDRWRPERRAGGATAAMLLLVLAFAIETLGYTPTRVPIEQWRQRLAQLAATPGAERLRSDSIVYVTGRADPSLFLTEIDAMLFAQDRKLPTLNGYSGNAPPDYRQPRPCLSAMAHVYAADPSAGRRRRAELDEVFSRTTWLRTEPCAHAHPATAFAPHPPTEAQARAIALSVTPLTQAGAAQMRLAVRIRNDGEETLHSLSRAGQTLRLSWRFVPEGSSAAAEPGWVERQDLDFSLPPGAEQSVDLAIALPAAPGVYDLQFSMVAEHFAWLHDLKMPVPHTRVVVPER